MNTRFSYSMLFIAAFAAAIFTACSKDNPMAPEETPPPADVNEYIAGLPSWNQVSPTLPDEDTATGESTEGQEEIGGGTYNCSTTPYSLTRTPDRVVTLDPDVEILWVGSLLQGKGHMGGIGSLAELPIRQRAPLTISIDLLTGENSRTVDNPTVATVNSAVGSLIQAAADAGHTTGSDVFFTQETAHSLVQAALSMGLSASYMGATIKASLESNISEETRTVTAYFVQKMFNVSMVLPQTPGSVFSDAFTADALQAQIDRGRIGPENLPVYVSNISYGRILMFSFTSSASLVDIKATLSALYNGGEYGGNLSTELKAVLDNAQIKVVTVGGDAANALALIKANDLGAYFTNDATLTSARPISYTVRNLGDNSIASVSETTDYNLKSCTPAEQPVTGSEYTIKFTRVKVLTLDNMDFCFLPPYYWDCYDIELQYTIYVDTPVGGPQRVLHFDATFLNPFAELLEEDETYVLPNNSTEVTVHFDGRDFVRLWGEMRDYDDLNKTDKLPFSKTFEYPGTPMPNASESYIDASDGSSVVRLYFTVTKGQDVDT